LNTGIRRAIASGAPQRTPTLLDILSPVSDSAGADVNIDITINNNSGSDTGNNGNIDLGEDPGVKEPELEETPTARDILTPIQIVRHHGDDTEEVVFDSSCIRYRFTNCKLDEQA